MSCSAVGRIDCSQYKADFKALLMERVRMLASFSCSVVRSRTGAVLKEILVNGVRTLHAVSRGTSASDPKLPSDTFWPEVYLLTSFYLHNTPVVGDSKTLPYSVNEGSVEFIVLLQDATSNYDGFSLILYLFKNRV